MPHLRFVCTTHKSFVSYTLSLVSLSVVWYLLKMNPNKKELDCSLSMFQPILNIPYSFYLFVKFMYHFVFVNGISQEMTASDIMSTIHTSPLG